MTSPPAFVLDIAVSNVRQGSGTVQAAASLPVSETALRLFCASVNEEERIERKIAIPTLRIWASCLHRSKGRDRARCVTETVAVHDIVCLRTEDPRAALDQSVPGVCSDVIVRRPYSAVVVGKDA